jgi:hypothetical protein
VADRGLCPRHQPNGRLPAKSGYGTVRSEADHEQRRAFPLFGDGDGASLTASYPVTLKQIITSP